MINVKLIQMDVGVPCYSQLHKNGVETAAVLGIAATVIGGFTAYAAASKTNQANAYINQQNIDAQKEMLAEQIRAGNDFSAMRSGAVQAGYSPYAVIGNSPSAGSSSSIPSHAMLNPAANLGFDKLADQLYNFNRLKSDVRHTDSESSKNEAETFDLMQRNQFSYENYLTDLMMKRTSAEKLGFDSLAAQYDAKFKVANFDNNLRQNYLTTKLLDKQIENAAADSTLKSWNILTAQKEFEYLDKFKKAELQEVFARIATQYSQQQLNRAQAVAATAHAIELQANSENIKVNTELTRRTADVFVDNMVRDNLLKRAQEMKTTFEAYDIYDPYKEGVFNNPKLKKGQTFLRSAKESFNTFNPMSSMFK